MISPAPASSSDLLAVSLRRAWAPWPHLPISEIAQRDLYLSREYSKEPGYLRIERTPFLAEIMDRLTPDDPVQTVVLKKPIQVGGTIVGQALVTSVIGYYPGPLLWVTDTDPKGQEFSKYRLDLMIRDSPLLRSRVAEAKARGRDNTIRTKTFPGGYLKVVGAQAASGLTSSTFRFAVLDEADDHAANVSYSGSSVSMAIGRQTTYGEQRKTLIVSSPKVAGQSVISTWFDRGDQRYYWVPCPRCGTYQPLEWRDAETKAYRLVYPKGHPEEARYQCRACLGLWENEEKEAFLPAGEWRPSRPDLGESGTVTSYALNALYSPAGMYSWADMARQWERAVDRQAAGDVEELRTFVNTRLGEAFAPIGEQIDPTALATREPREWGSKIPAGVLCIVIGVDVQDDRLEALTLGVGPGWELYVLDYTRILSDPLDQATWNALDAVVLRTFETEDGRKMRPAATCVDSGYRTQAVYDYTRTRKGWGVHATKGVPGAQKPIWDKAVRTTKRGTSRSQGRFWAVGTDTTKDKLFEILKVTKPGPKYLHVPRWIPARFPDWFDQLTAERRVNYRHRGKPVRGWRIITEGRRNEVLDCLVYALAAAYSVQMGLPGLFDAPEGERAQVETAAPPGQEPAQVPDGEVPPEVRVGMKRKPGRPRRGGGYFAGNGGGGRDFWRR